MSLSGTEWVPIYPIQSWRSWFLSYRSTERDVASGIRAAFTQRGQKVWMDEQRLVSGELWREEIKKAIVNCDAMILLTSPDVQDRPVIMEEIACALEQGLLIFPFTQHEQVELPPSLTHLHVQRIATDPIQAGKTCVEACLEPPEPNGDPFAYARAASTGPWPTAREMLAHPLLASQMAAHGQSLSSLRLSGWLQANLTLAAAQAGQWDLASELIARPTSSDAELMAYLHIVAAVVRLRGRDPRHLHGREGDSVEQLIEQAIQFRRSPMAEWFLGRFLQERWCSQENAPIELVAAIKRLEPADEFQRIGLLSSLW